MRQIILTGFLILLMIALSCEEQGFFVNCPDCTADEPLSALLEATLEPAYQNQTIIQIWEGNIEDSVLVGTYYSNSSTFSTEVTINKKYTMMATYDVGGNRYVALDSATPRVKYEKTQCTDPCYFIYNRKCDLSLKYLK